MESKTVSDKMVQIERLPELLQGTNNLLTLHRSIEQPNQMAIADCEELRNQYMSELAELLNEYDVTILPAHSAA